MRAVEALKHAAVFAFVVVALVVGAGAAGTVFDEPTPETPSPDAESFDPDSILVSPANETGEARLNTTESKVVVVDTSHGNAVEGRGIHPLTELLVDSGHEVRTTGSGKFNESLSDADALVVVNPSNEYTVDQVTGVEEFVDAGGRVAMIGESSEFTNLGSRFGVSFGAGYLYNMFRNKNNFRSIYASPETNSTLGIGVDRVVFHGATLVTGERDFVAANRTALSTTRETRRYGVVTRRDGVVAVGDSDFLAPSNFREEDNEVFVENLAEFLVTGHKTEEAPKPPE